MAPRTGRPPTGVTPRFNVRVRGDVAEMARRAARAQGKPVGKWVEEALLEKIERERELQGGQDHDRERN